MDEVLSDAPSSGSVVGPDLQLRLQLEQLAQEQLQSSPMMPLIAMMESYSADLKQQLLHTQQKLQLSEQRFELIARQMHQLEQLLIAKGI